MAIWLKAQSGRSPSGINTPGDSQRYDRARSSFDAAHELGHLATHGDDVWGPPEAEKQAHMFAGLLMPRAAVTRRCLTAGTGPRCSISGLQPQ